MQNQRTKRLTATCIHLPTRFPTLIVVPDFWSNLPRHSAQTTRPSCSTMHSRQKWCVQEVQRATASRSTWCKQRCSASVLIFQAAPLLVAVEERVQTEQPQAVRQPQRCSMKWRERPAHCSAARGFRPRSSFLAPLQSVHALSPTLFAFSKLCGTPALPLPAPPFLSAHNSSAP